ncbi:hypothetical protein [Saccharibacillus deserti]|uniref:hypothetical protein n=1 Tax=Saccharibacillus deserti TaxID=1634444 RepID=UPI001554B266|nr:hypothetical protein [Saccharibacillus deserti]
MRTKISALLISVTLATLAPTTNQVFASPTSSNYLNTQISISAPLTFPEMNRLYNHIYYADFFHQSEKLGLLLYSVNDTLDSAFKEIRDSDKNTEQNYVQTRLKILSDTRNSLSKRLQYINDAKVKETLGNYLKAINAYKTANSYLSKFYINPTQYNYSMYVSNAKKGAELASSASLIASERYEFYMGLSLEMASPNK